MRSGDFTGLRALEAVAGDRFRRGVVLHTGDEHVAFGPTLAAVPVESVWS